MLQGALDWFSLMKGALEFENVCKKYVGDMQFWIVTSQKTVTEVSKEYKQIVAAAEQRAHEAEQRAHTAEQLKIAAEEAARSAGLRATMAEGKVKGIEDQNAALRRTLREQALNVLQPQYESRIERLKEIHKAELRQLAQEWMGENEPELRDGNDVV